jgi:hypothetical protein
MKSALTLLTAFVLLFSSFMFSSCKGCKDKPPEDKTGGSGVENRGDAPAQSNPAPLPSSASSNPASAPTPASSGADVENREDAPANSNPAPAPAPAPTPVILTREEKIKALIKDKIVPDLYRFRSICLEIKSDTLTAGLNMNNVGAKVLATEMQSMSDNFFTEIGIHRDYIHMPVENCSLDKIKDENLGKAKTSLDKIITKYQEPLSDQVDNWFKNVDRSDSKSKLDACTKKLIPHQTEWENILKN